MAALLLTCAVPGPISLSVRCFANSFRVCWWSRSGGVMKQRLERGSGEQRRWWDDDARIDQLVYGVFKGGGAEGVAYVGALEALVERRVWFRSVAGSSAGAL